MAFAAPTMRLRMVAASDCVPCSSFARLELMALSMLLPTSRHNCPVCAAYFSSAFCMAVRCC